MEQSLETIDLDIEESNELSFKIKVEGAPQSPAKVRLVCEAPEVTYMFNGCGTNEDGVVQFTLPPMIGKISEGSYQSKVEVLIDNKYFSPVTFNINFKKAMTVVVESMQISKKIEKNSDLKVSIEKIISKLSIAPPASKLQIEQPRLVEAKKPEQKNITLKDRYESKHKIK